MSLQQTLDLKRTELQQIERDMQGINPSTFSYQRLRFQYDALIEQIHTLEAQREAGLKS